MKETTIGLKALNLLEASLSLAGILNLPIEGNCVRVNYQFAAELICSMQMAAKSAVDELLWLEEEREVEQ